ncbi:histidine phosphatase family protein [Kiloniella laminariae]|uniref:Histidine phosphatase family protein n=1 Tax=Kiloniella laminariae TaxID=454162 RepID=A0ABT4LJ64_9PROT|nr:histidine phosphatase family protein [Kiloniella laminariae]MCZ4281149.1 histidine phosphatase family protein [Kiloniella laminariae]
MSEILVLRHGPTHWNSEKRLQGRSDIVLSPTGRDLVSSWRLPADWLTANWLVSPLKRAQETAELLGQQKIITDPLLIEMSWGDWEGKRLPDLRADPDSQIFEQEQRGLDLLPPGGESPRQVQNRLKPLLQRLASQNNPHVCVAHKGVLRALYAMASGWNMIDKPEIKLRDSCAHLFHLSETGIPCIVAMNLSLLDPDPAFPLPQHISNQRKG